MAENRRPSSIGSIELFSRILNGTLEDGLGDPVERNSFKRPVQWNR